MINFCQSFFIKSHVIIACTSNNSDFDEGTNNNNYMHAIIVN